MHLSRLITWLIIIFAFVLLFYRLGSRPLNSWDEAVYAESAKEMAQDGDWLTPHWNHEQFLQKPPLFIWSAALLFKLFGVSEASARATSALAGVGCIVLVLFIVRLFSAEFTAVIAALILLATPGFKLNARYAMTDVILTFFMLLAIYAYLRTKENNRWWLLVGISCGLALLTKGAGALPLFAALTIVTGWKNRAAIQTQDFWRGLGLCLVLGGTWHFIMLALHGRTFVTEYFSSQVVNRTLQLVDSPEGRHGAFFYPYFVLMGFFPACLLLPLSIPGWFKTKRLPIVLPVFVATVFVLYFLAATKHQWYIVPIFPILSIIAAPLSKKVIPLFAVAIVGGLVFSASNRPSRETAAIAELSRRASLDVGPLGFYPGLLHGPEILFYSNRPLCADAPEHSMGLLARCPAPEHVIIATGDISSFPHIKELAHSGDFSYCRIGW